MDLMLSIVNLEKENYEKYVAALQASDMPTPIQWEIIDLLKTALAQTKQAESMGWL